MSIENKLDQFKRSVVEHFEFLKRTDSFDALTVKGIPLQEGRGLLLPISYLHLDDEVLIQKLTEWRNLHVSAFPTQFVATSESTKAWLQKRLLDVNDRILFLVLTKTGHLAGHIGLSNALTYAAEGKRWIEIDNVVRGEISATKGIMTSAIQSLIDWANGMFMPDSIMLRVFSDNSHAIRYYQKVGFVETKRIPLKKKVESNMTSFSETLDSSSADAFFLRMDYKSPYIEEGRKLILTAGPSISAKEKFYAFDSAAYGWNSKWSDYLKKLESTACSYLGSPNALATSSCTGALHLALETLGVGPGDEVIVPDITWVATANAVTYVGATPIFADVRMDSWCMDPASFESKITKSTKAVIPVHLYGHAAPMDEIITIAKKHGLFVVEDAAPALGTLWKNKPVATFGDLATFSFQGAKLAVSGEGGLLIVNNKDLFAKAYKIWDQGRDPSKNFWIDGKGWKYKMANVQAAVALAQVERVEELIYAKRRIFGWYYERLKNVKSLILNHEPEHTRSIYWMTSVLVSPEAKKTRDHVRAELREFNIDTRTVFPAISQYPIWPVAQESQPNAKYIGDTGINLPSGHNLQESQVDYICKKLCQILGE